MLSSAVFLKKTAPCTPLKSSREFLIRSNAALPHKRTPDLTSGNYGMSVCRHRDAYIESAMETKINRKLQNESALNYIFRLSRNVRMIF